MFKNYFIPIIEIITLLRSINSYEIQCTDKIVSIKLIITFHDMKQVGYKKLACNECF